MKRIARQERRSIRRIIVGWIVALAFVAGFLLYLILMIATASRTL